MLVFLLAFAIQSGPATSLPPSPQVQSRPVTVPDVDVVGERAVRENEDLSSRVVCHSERVTGSNRRQRICATVADRTTLRNNARRLADATMGGATANAASGEDWSTVAGRSGN